MQKTHTQTQEYSDLQNTIKLALARELEHKHISVEQVMAILFLFGQTTTVEQIEAFLDIFQETFPVLQHVVTQRSEENKVGVEDRVKKAATKMITKDPMRAAQLAKDALERHMTWDALVQKYPELGE